ncbi:MAG: RNA polymerase sigma factor [Planctomycetes bacterium]|nr:RNA polymerase sigma factor [Planctomycetota bacterium]
MHLVDQELLSRLLDEHSAALVLYAQQWCVQPEDVVQEAFIRLMRQRPANIVGWLYRVVRNEAISQSRSQNRRSRHEAAAGANRQAWFNTTEDNILDAAAAVAALNSLPIAEREVIVLRLWSGLSFQEIGELIGKSTSTAHRWYEAGLVSLRENWCIPCLTQKTNG